MCVEILGEVNGIKGNIVVRAVPSTVNGQRTLLRYVGITTATAAFVVTASVIRCLAADCKSESHSGKEECKGDFYEHHGVCGRSRGRDEWMLL
jgi:hypothetical protein